MMALIALRGAIVIREIWVDDSFRIHQILEKAIGLLVVQHQFLVHRSQRVNMYEFWVGYRWIVISYQVHTMHYLA